MSKSEQFKFVNNQILYLQWPQTIISMHDALVIFQILWILHSNVDFSLPTFLREYSIAKWIMVFEVTLFFFIFLFSFVRKLHPTLYQIN